jgi:hypothetical protein
MTNLADLLPAGGGQNNTDFVADGTITSGAPVVLTAAGKAAAITASTTAAAVQTQVNFYSSAVGNTNLVWDSTNSKAVVFYNRSSLTYCKVGSLSGSTLTWGTETSVIAGATSQNSVCFDSTGNKIIYMYEDGTGTYYTKAIVGEISGSSISFGSSSTVWGNANNGFYAVTYDSTNDRIVFAARIYSTYYGKAKVASLSGTTLTYGTEVTFESANTDSIGMCFDSTAGKVLIVYRDNGNSYYGTAVVGTVSGTSISFGTPAVYNSSDSSINQAAHDPTANKNLIAYYGSTPGYSFGVVATISGTSVTFGTPVNSSNSVTVSTNWDRAPVVYNAEIKKPVFLYQEGASPYNLKYSIGTITGTAIAFSDHTTIGPYAKRYPAAVYDPATKQMITAFRSDSPDEGQSYVFNQEYTTTNLTSTNLLGIASGAISDTATGTINTWGSRNEAAFPVLATGSTTNLTGKTQSPYPDITYDITQGKFVVFFEDGNNSNYGTAVVATVSGSTVSFGTPVVFNSGTTIALGATYSEANGRHVVVYPNYSDSQKATAAVGTVSGTSISFGTPVVFDSTITNTQCSVAYNSTLGKYLAGAMTSTIKVTVLTVDPSDNSVTFGTPVSLTGTRYKPNIVSNESASDFVLTNNLNDNQSEAHLISVSGTTPTVEDTETLSSVVTYSYPTTGLVFLENNKFLSVYYDQGTENTYARTITVSGSSLSLGTESAAFNTDPGNQTMINGRYPLFFVSTTEAYLYYQDDATDYLRYVPITVSGTTATSGTEVTYYSTAVAYEGFGYNSSTKQSLSFFQGNDGGQQTQAVAQNGALVIGTDYYVQTDGSLSTDTGGQLIGQAITDHTD